MPQEPKLCACGCGGTTRGGEFLPGHDGRHLGNLLRRVREDADFDAAEEMARRRWHIPADAIRALRP